MGDNDVENPASSVENHNSSLLAHTCGNGRDDAMIASRADRPAVGVMDPIPSLSSRARIARFCAAIPMVQAPHMIAVPELPAAWRADVKALTAALAAA